MLVNENANYNYLGRTIQQFRHIVSEMENNTVDGTIGMLEPTIFAENQNSVNHQIYPKWVNVSLHYRGASWLDEQPEARQKWIDFLKRVAAEAPNEKNRQAAEGGLKQMGVE